MDCLHFRNFFNGTNYARDLLITVQKIEEYRSDIKIKEDNKNKEFENEYIVIVRNITCIKVANRGQWMQDK